MRYGADDSLTKLGLKFFWRDSCATVAMDANSINVVLRGKIMIEAAAADQ